jgi:DNA modification methylase
MTTYKKSQLTRNFTLRISEHLFNYLKSKDKPSAYIRELIERDIQAVKHENA